MFTPLTLTRWRPLSDDGSHEVDSLLLAERRQGDLIDRQVTAQIGQLRGQLRVQFQPFTAHRPQQQYPTAMPAPGVAQVAQQVERGPIHPVQVLQ